MIKVRNKNKISKCLECDKEFLHFNWDNQKYCSKKCCYNKDKIICKCDVCGNNILKSKSISERNNLNYCSRECYNNRHKGNLKRLKRGTSYYDDLLSKSKCKCGISELYLLQIHHIDGNHNNNSPENLEVVCANCHIKRHLTRRAKDGKLVYNPKSLTDSNLLKDL